MDAYITLVQLIGSTVRVSVPLLLACLAGLYSERSGVFDIGLEGKMLAGAFAAGLLAFTAGRATVLAAGLVAFAAGFLVLAATLG